MKAQQSEASFDTTAETRATRLGSMGKGKQRWITNPGPVSV